jgi:hyperosmotically inducible protein
MKRTPILGVFTLLAVVSATASTHAASVSNGLAQESTIEKGADKTKGATDKAIDAVAKGTTVAVDSTKHALSKSGEVMTDSWVTTRVHARFVDETLLKDSDISVDSTNHVVTLKGTVLTKAGRTKATTIAKGTEGVRSVVNQLTIGPKRAA